MSTEILDIVNENDEVIGQATREEAHDQGLLHRTIGVWFFNKNGQVIFQRRGKLKGDGGLLGASVGGHVEAGQAYMDVVIKEMKEETGLEVQPKDLLFVGQALTVYTNNRNKKIHELASLWALHYPGKIEDLQIEEGEGDGFEWWDIETVLHLPTEERKRFGGPVFIDGVLKSLEKVLELSRNRFKN